MSATGYLARAMARAYPCLALSFPSMRRHVQPSPFFPLNVVLLGPPHWYGFSQVVQWTVARTLRRQTSQLRDNVRLSSNLLNRIGEIK